MRVSVRSFAKIMVKLGYDWKVRALMWRLDK